MLNSFFNTLLAASTGVAGSIPKEVRDAVCMAFMILMMIASVAMIVIVLMQKGTNENVGAITGVSDTYFGKNKERSKANILKIVTYVLFAFIIVCAIIYCVIRFVA